jgi:hypothetical protein
MDVRTNAEKPVKPMVLPVTTLLLDIGGVMLSKKFLRIRR